MAPQTYINSNLFSIKITFLTGLLNGPTNFYSHSNVLIIEFMFLTGLLHGSRSFYIHFNAFVVKILPLITLVTLNQITMQLIKVNWNPDIRNSHKLKQALNIE